MKRLVPRKRKEIAKQIIAGCCVILLLTERIGLSSTVRCDSTRAHVRAAGEGKPAGGAREGESDHSEGSAAQDDTLSFQPIRHLTSFSRAPLRRAARASRGKPTRGENAALATALLGYSKRLGPDDYSSLTGFWKNIPTPRGARRSSPIWGSRTTKPPIFLWHWRLGIGLGQSLRTPRMPTEWPSRIAPLENWHTCSHVSGAWKS